jgi:hypothetical protein
MIDAGILEGDYVVVRPQETARDGEIVVALVGEEATVKRFFREADHVRLQPENARWSPSGPRTCASWGASSGSSGASDMAVLVSSDLERPAILGPGRQEQLRLDAPPAPAPPARAGPGPPERPQPAARSALPGRPAAPSVPAVS